jgi:hypothetical protein
LPLSNVISYLQGRISYGVDSVLLDSFCIRRAYTLSDLFTTRLISLILLFYKFRLACYLYRVLAFICTCIEHPLSLLFPSFVTFCNSSDFLLFIILHICIYRFGTRSKNRTIMAIGTIQDCMSGLRRLNQFSKFGISLPFMLLVIIDHNHYSRLI